MKSIEFDVLWWDNSQTELSELGIRPDVTEADTRLVTFYRVDNISPYFEGGMDFTTIRSGGEEFIVANRYSEVKKILGNLTL